MINSIVIKPTERCNFNCTFCSSTSISDNVSDIVELNDIKAIFQRHPDIKQVIINGGDPLMMAPSYYEEMLDYLVTYIPDAIMSITSNLWAFYKKPDKWMTVFTHPNVSVMTSFQYGNKRLKGDFTPFTEEEFWNVSDLMLERCGYRPDFIAVIDEDNADTVLDTVRLAKSMGVDAKVNYAMASGTVVTVKGHQMGNEDNLFLLANMYSDYLSIYEAGLAPWEYNTRQMTSRLQDKQTTCPLSRHCDEGIRTIQPSGRYYSCPAMADDDLYRLSLADELANEIKTPLQEDPDLLSMKTDCFTCPLFSICNGCRKTIRDHKRLGLVEAHCYQMKKLAPRLIHANGMHGKLFPTPYVNEDSLIAVG